MPLKPTMHRLPGTTGGICLDGTPGVFTHFEGDPKRWMIYLMAGGWCYTERDCADRASNRDKTNLGGTSHLKIGNYTFDEMYELYPMAGLLSNATMISPSFSNMTKVYVHNCDGGSFSGDRQDPIWAAGHDGINRTVWFRGARILDGVLDVLTASLGLLDAEEVAFVGGSAGGAAVILHADEVRDKLEQRRGSPYSRFKAMAYSGFFPRIENAQGQPVYESMIKNVFDLHHARPNQACSHYLHAQGMGEQQWTCFFTDKAYSYTTTPIMLTNSVFDAWGVWYIYQGTMVPGFPAQKSCLNYRGDGLTICNGAPGTADAAMSNTSMYVGEFPDIPDTSKASCPSNPMACTAPQIAGLNGFMLKFREQIQSSSAFTRAGNGAFLYTCHTHQVEHDGHYRFVTAQDAVMNDVVENWWHAAVTEPAETYTKVDTCAFGTVPQYPGGMCNPSCNGKLGAMAVEPPVPMEPVAYSSSPVAYSSSAVPMGPPTAH
jgi:hypothetical protein